jgi:uncharacterized membrane protein
MYLSVLILTAILAVLAPASADAKTRAVRTEISALSGPRVQVRSMNNRGTIVGSMSPDPNSQQAPFRWTKTRGVDFFLGYNEGAAVDINDSGAIVGYLVQPASVTGFLWTPQDGYTDLGEFFPYAINNRGQIAGGMHSMYGVAGARIWYRGVLTEIPGAETTGAAMGIGENGRVVGQTGSDAFVWSPRTGMRILPNSGGSNPVAAAFAISNRGEAVGFEAPDTIISYPARWSRTGELTSFPQFAQGTFEAINASGLAVGRYPNSSNFLEGFAVTRRGTVVSLGEAYPVAVNDSGRILGSSGFNETQRVFIWRIVN